ncbi:MAG: hypothetical protein R2912_02370 [Eubacteriales bacterium]
MILQGESGVRKEERFYFLLEQLLREYAATSSTEQRSRCAQRYRRFATI